MMNKVTCVASLTDQLIIICKLYKTVCLQAMQWRRDVDGKLQCPELFFVGTHRDLENKQETVHFKNECLKDKLLQHSQK